MPASKASASKQEETAFALWDRALKEQGLGGKNSKTKEQVSYCAGWLSDENRGTDEGKERRVGVIVLRETGEWACLARLHRPRGWFFLQSL